MKPTLKGVGDGAPTSVLGDFRVHGNRPKFASRTLDAPLAKIVLFLII